MPTSFIHRAVLAAAFATTTALAGCGSDSPTETTIFGTYNLTTIDGHGLPHSELDGTTTVTLVSGSVTLKSDHTFTRLFNFTETIGTVTQPDPDTSSGTFSVSGSAITFVEDGDMIPGTMQGNTLTVTNEGRVYVLKK
jgi:hypothetical protein